MFSDATALFLAQSERRWTGGGPDQPDQPTFLGGGGAWEGESAGAEVAQPAGAGEVTPAPAGAGAESAELKFHKWQPGRGALASERVHRHLR